ncbi:hypothetical protein B0J13DRAFT_477266 [Dactylonectria estremocensis]|uniref:Zn(2)-C6 fungal-type domain-containing protein n=1 Tax=Dactylonectria estremocensis TaxID=1079267 RepID=A0A9P9EN98_9HYPO|nr:hypothetical protein B0J13DRAFT_477266 [Dactylonectria estremocensis]
MANDKAKPSTESGTGRRRRAPHKKVRTGCNTCKIRRVRCDEGKPDCNRCLSTGRKCDGYALHVGLPKQDPNERHYQPSADSRLILPPKSLAEMRSYQFFVEVTAPAIATTFDSEFWRSELPRICQSDPAIWHAVVSLGCVHERYLSRAPDQHADNAFAMQQFNASVRCLTAPTCTDKWRALAISTIFICACHLEGHSDQARMHLKSGRKLLQEIREEEAARQPQKCPVGPPTNWSARTKPISLSMISSILTGFQISEQALSQGGISNFPTLISDHDSFTTWRYYTAPSKPPYMTSENLTRASRAAESLINGLTFFMQRHADEIKDLFLGKGEASSVESIASKQQPETRCFTQLSKVIRLFKREQKSSHKLSDVAECRLQRTLLSLTLCHETSRLLLLKDPDEPDIVKRGAGLPAASIQILNLAEKILELNQDKDDKAFVPNAPTSTPLFILAHSGFTQDIRRRAIALLKRPQMVGMWDTVMTARLGELIMDREESAAYEDRLRKIAEGALAPERNDDLPVGPLHRIFSMTFKKTGRRTAAVSMRTWQEWMQGEPGQKVALEW